MKFIIIHGSFGSPEGNWFPELKTKLNSLQQDVWVPSFPVDEWGTLKKGALPKKQTLKKWLKAFDPFAKKIKKGEAVCFIGHSLGCLFILHLVEHYKLTLDSAIFVSPFLHKLNKEWQLDHVNGSFYKTDFDFKKLKEQVPVSYVLYSENDPYVEKHQSLGFAKRLNSSPLFVKHAGHMNLEVNLNEFPLVFELCKTRLDLSLYQKYMAHRRELYAVDYTDPKSEEVLYLEPKEVFDEGVFKFRNLKKSGFCTFLSSLKFWDTQATYYKQARLAAKRVKDFTRVFVIDEIEDLKKKNLLKHIKLDFEAGIKVYLCMLSDVQKITSEPDFGIWDEDYLCMIRMSKNEQTEVKLSSRKKDIQEALKWKTEILKVAVPIENLDRDLKKFICF